MKRGQKMLLLLFILAVLIGGYFGAQQLSKTKSVTEIAETFSLKTQKPEDLAGISWTKDNIFYSFLYTDGTWKTEDVPAWPVKQESVQALADKLNGLQATRKLENVSNPADYGLATPTFTVTATWRDGSATTYAMGDATPFADGYYLSLTGQDNTVYTVADSLAAIFNQTQKDLAAMDKIPSVADPVHLIIGNTLDVMKLTESKTVNPSQLWYDSLTNEPVDELQIEDLIKNMSDITWSELFSAASSDEDQKARSLDDKSATMLTLTGSDNSSLCLLIGAQNNKGDFYVRLSGSSMIYTVKCDKINSLLSASADNLWIKTVLPMPYESLASADFTTEKVCYHLDKAAEKQASDETGTEIKAIDESTGTYSAKAQKELWSLVTALNASERLKEKTKGDQVLSILAVSTDAKETNVIFYEYNIDSYQAEIDGKATLLVPAEKVDLIIRTIHSMQ